MSILLQYPAHPGRVGAYLDGDVQRLFRIEAAPDCLWGGAQPTLLDDLAALRVDEVEIAVLVAEVHSSRHLHLLPATITHGPILLSGPPKEPVDYLQTLYSRVLREGSAFSSHLKSSSSTSFWCETPRRTPYRSGGKPILGVTAALWRDFGSVLEPFWFDRRANRALIDISHHKLVLVFGAKLRGAPVQERWKADFGSNRSFMEGFW